MSINPELTTQSKYQLFPITVAHYEEELVKKYITLNHDHDSVMERIEKNVHYNPSLRNQKKYAESILQISDNLVKDILVTGALPYYLE